MECFNYINMILSKPYILEGFLLKEKSDIHICEKVHKYDYVSINMNEILVKEQSDEFHNFQYSLNDDYIYREDNDYGIERDHHITVFYGLVNNSYNYKLIKQFIDRNIEKIEIQIKGIDFFRNEAVPYDVMKFDIESESLQRIHTFINTLDNESTYVDYKPHMTIAYIKKGAFNDNQWRGYNKFSFCSSPVTIPEIEFQDIYGDKKIIYI